MYVVKIGSKYLLSVFTFSSDVCKALQIVLTFGSLVETYCTISNC
jgi:hypothetical protein